MCYLQKKFHKSFLGFSVVFLERIFWNVKYSVESLLSLRRSGVLRIQPDSCTTLFMSSMLLQLNPKEQEITVEWWWRMSFHTTSSRKEKLFSRNGCQPRKNTNHLQTQIKTDTRKFGILQTLFWHVFWLFTKFKCLATWDWYVIKIFLQSKAPIIVFIKGFKFMKRRA